MDGWSWIMLHLMPLFFLFDSGHLSKAITMPVYASK